jgi:D-alanyl-D-alanine carboxypeptidase
MGGKRTLATTNGMRPEKVHSQLNMVGCSGRKSLMRLVLLLVAIASTSGIVDPLSAAHLASRAEVSRYANRLLTDNYGVTAPGAAVIVARGDRILFRGARGVADVQHGTPLTADALFDIGSVSKQFAAAGLLKLVEAGKLSLNDPLSKFVKNFPGGDRISVLELLNHTSGVKNYSDDPSLKGKALSIAQAINSFKNEKVDFAPGEGWAYDNSGYVLVGAVIEAASGMPWQRYLQQALFDPLHLAHTGTVADPQMIAQRVHGYVIANGKPVPVPPTAETQPFPDGAIVSNVDDLLKWNLALHEGRVLRSATYRTMITPVGKAKAEQYGFGLVHTTLRGHEMIGHSGWVSGFTAYLLYLPQSRISVAMLQNTDRDPHVPDLRVNARKIAAFAIGEPYREPTPIAVNVAALHEAEGAFGVDPPGPRFGSIQARRVLRVVEGALTIAQTGGQRSQLTPLGQDTFQDSAGFDRIQLIRDHRGTVSGLSFFPWGEGRGQLLAREAGSQPAAPIALPADAQSDLLGDYMFNGIAFRVYLKDGHLIGEFGGDPSNTAVLFAETPRKFFAAEVDATALFVPQSGPAQSMILDQGGERMEFKRTLH